MSKPVFLIATQRSGTNYLRQLLKDTGEFGDFGEIFDTTTLGNTKWTHQFFLYRMEQIKLDPSLSIPLESNVKTLFNGYIEYLANFEKNKPYFLVDVKYQSLHHLDTIWQQLFGPNNIFKLINDNNYKVIHLVRQNLFEIFVSHQLALTTGKYHKKYDQSNSKNAQVKALEINPLYMLREIERLELEQKRVRRFLWPIKDKLEISYEALKCSPNNMPEHLRVKLNAFFELTFSFKEQATFKKGIQNPLEVISNKREVIDCLTGSRFSKFIEVA